MAELIAGPIMKWAGGKTQMLDDIKQRMPKKFNKYIEPFFGGGALFFNLILGEAIIADSNSELINMYVQVMNSCEDVIDILKGYKNDEETFYEVRSVDWTACSEVEAAARTLYLNHTCFNGLYRLNKQGKFNTPFGKYKNPTICNEEKLRAASEKLKHATIICADYLEVLRQHAQPGDFIFLDPPYVPISDYSDFKRYTKEQFYEDDQRALAEEIHRLSEMGCYIMHSKSYSYTTPNDTGTGSRTRGMMLFDYVSLSNTPLPALIEDSMTLKQIEDEAMIKLFELFNESKKQVFVAIDKAESYSDDNTVPPVFSKTTVLELSAGHELFGRAWNKSEEK